MVGVGVGIGVGLGIGDFSTEPSGPLPSSLLSSKIPSIAVSTLSPPKLSVLVFVILFLPL